MTEETCSALVGCCCVLTVKTAAPLVPECLSRSIVLGAMVIAVVKVPVGLSRLEEFFVTAPGQSTFIVLRGSDGRCT